jgi:hypothetical protein
MNKEELQFERKVKITIKVIFVLFLKVLLYGAVLLTFIAIITNNSSLIYPYGDEAFRNMLIQVFVLGLLFIGIENFIKKMLLKRKK